MGGVPWGVVAPLVVVQLVLLVVGLRDLIRRRETNGPKWVWAIVMFFGIIGPIVYFLAGRKES